MTKNDNLPYKLIRNLADANADTLNDLAIEMTPEAIHLDDEEQEQVWARNEMRLRIALLRLEYGVNDWEQRGAPMNTRWDALRLAIANLTAD